jgi:iron complex outermembrane receptor protein
MEAETSDQFSFGVAFEPLDWLNGTIDYWNIKVDNRLALPTVQTMVNCLAGATNLICPPEIAILDPLGSPPFEELGAGIARVDGDGEIAYAQRKWINLGTLETDGIDVALRTNFSFGEAGTLRNELLATYTNSFEVDGGSNLVGEANYPEWRAILANVYTWGDFTVAWNINYIHGQDSALDENDTDGLPSWTTHDIQVNYFTAWNGRVTVGVDNIGDKDPVVDFGESRSYNTALYDPYGRVVYARYLQSF